MSLDAEVMRLTKIGTVIITEHSMCFDGFEGINCSCRDVAALASAWAIGELQQELVATLQEPGSGNASVD